MTVPVITIDGPSGSGKGTVTRLLAAELGWHVLDSGALYRLVGLAAERAGCALDDGEAVAALVPDMQVGFRDEEILLDGEPVAALIRTEAGGNRASKVASLPAVRTALLQWQRDYAAPPGLIADGRDMGTVVFPHSPLKVFLDASAEERASRRYKQLREKGIDANFPDLVKDIQERDARDRQRSTAPLVAAADALVVDSTRMDIDAVLACIRTEVQRVFPDAVA